MTNTAKLLIPAGLIALLLAEYAWPATYNFYFNNTEQGDNSTAAPTVTVSDDKGGSAKTAGKGAMAGPAPATASAAPASTGPQPANEATPAEPAANTSAALAPALPIGGSSDPRFRIAAGVGLLTSETNVGLAASMSWFFTHDLAIGAFGGVGQRYYYDYYDQVGYYDENSAYLGGELSIEPIHVSIGRFENLLQGGFMAGVSTLGAAKERGNPVAGFVGARLGVNLARNWGVSSEVRANLGMVQGEAGLMVRL